MSKSTYKEEKCEKIYKSTFKLNIPIVVLIGDQAVGKTCLLNRFIKGTIPKTKAPTIGVEFATRIVELKEGIYVKAQIWDTVGQEKYRAMIAAYPFDHTIYRHYRKAVGGLVVYDVTKRASFDNACWKQSRCMYR